VSTRGETFLSEELRFEIRPSQTWSANNFTAMLASPLTALIAHDTLRVETGLHIAQTAQPILPTL
jgi:hypothetical protein